MEVIGPIIEILNFLWVPLSQPCSHAKSLEQNVKTLRSKMEELSCQEKDLESALNKGKLQEGKKPKHEVRLWQENVQRLANEVHKIAEKSRENVSCLKGCFPNYSSRIKLSKLAVGMIREVVELQEKGRFFDDLFAASSPGRGKTLPTTELVGRTTTEKTREAIWESLMDNQFGIIGVYGIGGVGKTAIMKHIHNRLIEASTFDSVIWVTLSKDSNLKQFQDHVARAFDLELPDNADLMRRSQAIFAALKRRKRFVLILDDMWVAFPIERVGIPNPDRENGCKLVLTTRSLEICQHMETQRAIKVEVLSEEEAWELFKDKVGGVVFSPQVEEIAKLVAKECCRLPLAIITVGRSMREVNDIRLWRNTLNELQSSTMEIRSIEENVFARLQFSYTRLRNDTIRACFLYCALYPEDFAIPSKELIEYWMGEGFIDDMGNREAEIDKGHAILNELKYAGMLEGVFDGIYGDCVTMHDLIRDMAISITRDGPQFWVKVNVGLTEMPKVEEWMEHVQRISLMRNKIEILSGQPNCPRLSTLLLQENRHLKDISHSFFGHMNNLRVLDLSYTKIKELPQSISNLGNLHTLLLHYCVRLNKLPSLANLKALRVLDLYYAPIAELPQGMEGLVNLRRLDLSWTYKLHMFPTGIVSRLSLLEDLTMYGNPWRWSSNSAEIGGGSIDEIKSLTQLANLSIHIGDVPSFLDYVRSMKWQALKSFHLMVGLTSESISLPLNCTVEFHSCDLISHKNSLMVPYSTQVLCISECNITRLSELSSLLNVMKFKECYIHNCDAMQCIIMDDENTLPSLETLELKFLPSLSSLYKGVVLHGTLGSLKKLYVGLCNNLKNLFSLELLKHLQNLEQVEIRYCDMMEEVVEEEGEIVEGMTNTTEIVEDITKTTSTIILPRLKSLSVNGLQELKSICRGIIICNSLCTIRVHGCPKLKKLPLSNDYIPPTLKEIKGERNWWDSLEWEDANVKTLLQHRFMEIAS